MKHQSKYRDRSEMKTSTYLTCKVIKEGRFCFLVQLFIAFIIITLPDFFHVFPAL